MRSVLGAVNDHYVARAKALEDNVVLYKSAILKLVFHALCRIADLPEPRAAAKRQKSDETVRRGACD